jgi:hypothetical protein
MWNTGQLIASGINRSCRGYDIRCMPVLLFTGFLLTCRPAAFCFQQASGGHNAALKYLRAYAAIHQAQGIPNLGYLVENYNSVSIDDKTIAAVKAAESGLREVHDGAALRDCDWGVSLEEGVDTDTSHRGVARELTGLLALRARFHFARLRTAEGVNDLLAGIAVARHLSTDGSLTSALIAGALEDGLARLLASHLPKLARPDLTRILDRLETLPPGSAPGQALLSQSRISRARLTRIVRSAGTRDELVRRLAALPMLGRNAVEFLAACGGAGDGVIGALEELTPKYAAWLQRFDMPPQEFERKFLLETASLKQRNAVFRMLTPSIPRVQREEAITRVRRALLRTAVAVQRDGASVLKRYPDPHSGAAFLHFPTAGGFQLQSRLNVNNEPLELIIGVGRAQ